MLKKPSLQARKVSNENNRVLPFFAQYLKVSHANIQKKDVKTAFSFVEQQQLWQ